MYQWCDTQGAGQKLVQDKPCSVWDYGDRPFVLRDLALDVELILRFSAPGYGSQEVTVMATASKPYTDLIISLPEM